MRPFTHQSPFREIGRLLAGKANATSLVRHESGPFCVDAVYRDLDRKVSRRVEPARCDAVYAYEDGALESFRVANQKGVRCFYDLPIGYWRSARKLQQAEMERWPEWAPTMPAFKDSDEKLARKDEELRLADAIFVASSFTASTLSDYPTDSLAKTYVIPYGFPVPGPERDYSNLGKRKLRLLYVGGLTQRKGLADVFSVADSLSDDVELTVVGRGAVNECAALRNALAKHRWIPSLPHDQVLAEMRNQDVLLFPSSFEGFGLVITEAMSQGTPVITTDRTAGGDIIDHGSSGWIVPASNTLALKSQVEELLKRPDQIANAGNASRNLAAERPWECYGHELASKVAELLSND
ncbi:glycosyltransferase family 4 protein [Rhodopirellula sp. MGV]|uniref:glycosyltransferase family 4 protein n=1 Tax=Rhodopirellula sp. MGV TaxID=2023130 RepID=UPI001E2B6229|nr:glycosyltransferase family 4 protein [Rhodopirellula sp. MGV]